MTKRNFNFLTNLKNTLNQYLTFSFWLLVAAILIRLFEAIILTYTTGVPFGSNLLYNCKGLFFDMVYFARCSLILYPIFFLLSLISSKLALWTFRILFTVILLISLSAIIYYSIAGILLDSVIFSYSVKELLFTISSSQQAPWWAYLSMLAILLFFLFIYNHQIGFLKYWCWFCAIFFISSLFVGKITAKQFENNRDFYTANNKVVYLCQSIREGVKFTKFTPQQMEEKTAVFQSYFPEYQFVDSRYPFLYFNNAEDNLTPFFNFSPEKPNLVFIIVEGLGREFSGEFSKYPSATPFLDSLAKIGLSWQNCLSTAQRTFAVMPAIFGALPFGKNGFMSYKNNLPEFNSLIKILIDNGYKTSFFYGGWLYFDDMYYFLNNNHIKHFLDENRLQNINERNQWGVYDHQMFKEAINQLQSDTSQPRLDIYLTVTTHDPFEYPNADKLTQYYQNELKKNGKLKEIPPKHVKNYASFLYLDNSIRQLIQDYQKRSDFDNTIFIITGDHHFNMQAEELAIYHVPFIIWSPLLKQSKQFPALASHRDITPAMLALLSTNFKISSPEKVAWINRGLDTSSAFRATTFIPMMDLGRNLSHLVYKNYFITKNEVKQFEYKENVLSLKKSDKEELFTLFDAYKILDLHVAENDAIIENRVASGESFSTTILDISSSKNMIDYLQPKIDEPFATFQGEKNAIFFKNYLYPLNILTLELENKQTALLAQYEFKIFIPRLTNKDENAAIQLVTVMKRSNGEQYYWSNEELNTVWYGQYDKWATFTFKELFKKKNYNYQDGDILSIYLYNPSQRPFYFSNLKLKVEELN